MKLVDDCDVKRGRIKNSTPTYQYYVQSLANYISWIKEQVSKSNNGYIRIRRYDLAVAMKKELSIIMGDKYKDINFKTMYDLIKIILFDNEIFTTFGIYEREKIFILRNRTDSDRLPPKLLEYEKILK